VTNKIGRESEVTLFQKEPMLNTKHEIQNPKQYQMTKGLMFQTRDFRDFENSNLFRMSIFEFRIFKGQPF